jgi:hypothetical protein
VLVSDGSSDRPCSWHISASQAGVCPDLRLNRRPYGPQEGKDEMRRKEDNEALLLKQFNSDERWAIRRMLKEQKVLLRERDNEKRIAARHRLKRGVERLLTLGRAPEPSMTHEHNRIYRIRSRRARKRYRERAASERAQFEREMIAYKERASLGWIIK